MSDFNDPNRFDKYGNPIPGPTVYDPAGPGAGRAPFVLLGILVLIGIIGGALYFNGAHRTRSNTDVANAPAMSDTTTRTAPGPTSLTPVTPAPAPAPAATPAPDTTQK